MEKARIAAILGERGLLMPTLVNAALAANERSKFLFTLLQAAVGRARSPERPVPDLRRERIACGIGDESLDATAGAAREEPDGRIRIPGAEAIVRRLCAEVATMLAPFADDVHSPLRERFEALRAGAESLRGDVISAADVDALASAGHGRDTLHRLVMDLHRALNALQARIASEVIEGASAYGLAEADRAPVAAFMRGVRRTAPLKFDHPGLGTTATRSGETLVIQNDLGTTDAHVLVLHVDGLAATLRYTDVHLPRLLFFQRLFEPWAVQWSDTFSRRDAAVEDGVFHLCEGAFTAATREQLEEYLGFLGSRLVFLVDWNKARKRLRALVSKDEAGRLLEWAARGDLGHMGFLKAGGELLVYDALDFVMKGGARFGQKLDDILGKREAADYLRFLLRTCAEAFLRGETESFVQDAARAELFNNFRTLQEQLYEIVADHAALTVEIAGGVRDGLLQLRLPDAGPALARAAARAKDWESRADDLVNRARGATGHGDPASFFRAIVESADQVADELEEAAFNLTLLPRGPGPAAGDARLQALAELLVQGAQEYVKVVESARHVRRGGLREDTQDFLAAAHRIQEIEHGADAAQRAIRAEALAGIADPGALHVTLAITRNLEGAADALMHCGMRMREHVLAEVLAK